MIILYIVEEDKSSKKLKIISKNQYKPIAFDRLEHILLSLGFKYNVNYSSVTIYKNDNDYEVDDTIDLSKQEMLVYKTYCSNVSLGEYYDNMLIKINK